MMSGVARHRTRSFFPWRMISCAAANGMRCVKPARYAVSPSFTSAWIASFIDMTLLESIGRTSSWLRDELEPVADDALLAVDPAEFREDPHPHADVLRAYVGHLPDDLRALVELDDRDGIGARGLLLLRELRGCPAGADEGERVDLPPAAEGGLHEVGGGVAVLADALRREAHRTAGLARLPDEPVSLGDRAPVHGDGHMGHGVTSPDRSLELQVLEVVHVFLAGRLGLHGVRGALLPREPEAEGIAPRAGAVGHDEDPLARLRDVEDRGEPDERGCRPQVPEERRHESDRELGLREAELGRDGSRGPGVRLLDHDVGVVLGLPAEALQEVARGSRR